MTRKTYYWLYMYLIGTGFFIFFLSEIYNGKLSLEFWKEIRYDYSINGFGNAIILTLLYINFFLGLATIPYGILYFIYYLKNKKKEIYTEDQPSLSYSQHSRCLMFSIWVLVSFIFLHESIFAFIKKIPTNLWNGWAFIAYLLFSILFIGSIFIKDKKS